MSAQGTTRIFISYSRSDQDFARRLATSLSQMGADVWIDVEDIPVGMKWSSAIQQGLDGGQLLIVIISPDSMASRNVEDEWQYYLDGGKPIVPVLLRPAKIHFQLNRLQYIDFHSQTYEKAIGQLYAELWAKGLSLNPPQAEEEQQIPDLDSMSPAEVEHWLGVLQKRQAALSQVEALAPDSPEAMSSAQPTLHIQRESLPLTPSPSQPTQPNRKPLILGAVALVAVIVVITLIVLASSNPPSEAARMADGNATALAIAQANQTATSQAVVQANATAAPDLAETATVQYLSRDDDADGLTNAQEAQYGTYPDDPDSDGDGLPDGDEVGSCTSPLSMDTDQDGTLDNVEVMNGTQCDSGPQLPGLSVDDPVAHNADWTPVEQDFDGVAMMLVPVGHYIKGSTPDTIDTVTNDCWHFMALSACQDLFADEAPTYAVSVDAPFWIDRYEVNNQQFDDFGGTAAVPGGWPDPQQPRTHVTWSEAEAYCELRGMTLPTEIQWEYASRGPDSWLYPWGNQFSGSELNYCDSSCEYDWRDMAHNDGYAIPAPVGSFPSGASWVGALDLAGNVWEWTRTIYTEDARNGYEDPGDADSPRVLKGGTWNWVLQETRGATRAAHAPDIPFSSWYGFRCVRAFDMADLGG